jgi:hypothetical protein
MRTIIAGSRDITNRSYLEAALQACPWTREITVVICGGANGVDELGDKWALRAGLPVEYFLITNDGKYRYERLANLRRRGFSDERLLYAGDFPPETFVNVTIASDWEWNGSRAGPIRNRRMAQSADALIAIPLKGRRRGTDSMIREAKLCGLKIFIKEMGA